MLPFTKTTSAGSAGGRNDGVRQNHNRLSAVNKLFIISFQLFMRDSSSEQRLISQCYFVVTKPSELSHVVSSPLRIHYNAFTPLNYLEMHSKLFRGGDYRAG